MKRSTKQIAVVLSGCGSKDGSEITEAVSALIALSEMGANYQCFAPDLDCPATNFITGRPMEGQRNLMVESTRITREKTRDVTFLRSEDFDGVVFPGGFGAALNLSDFGKKGSGGQVLPSIERVIREFHRDSKPIAAICIAPALLALVLGDKNITITLGQPSDASREIAKTGAHHEVCAVDDFVTDRENKLVTTPAYMYDEAKPSDVFKGIRGAIRELVEMS